jgi:16S rRNA (guanine1516-N2)-methyltransferase
MTIPPPDNARPILEIDYTSHRALRRLQQFSRGKELIQRGCGITRGQPLSVFDATPGCGYDSIALALAGASVTMCERCPEVANALTCALQHGRIHAPAWLREALERITCVADDSIHHLAALQDEQKPHVIIVDPMFPEEGRTALSKKEIQALRALCGDDPDAPTLLRVALSSATKRVVVKRRLKDPYIGEMQPHFSLRGTTVRIDIYNTALK